MKIPRFFVPLLTVFCAVSAVSQVPYEKILRGSVTPADWLTYSGNYAGHRYSALTEITRLNVSRLRPAWVYQVRQDGVVETSPIVADGIMYISEPLGAVTAIEARAGRPLWSYVPRITGGIVGTRVNRGVAILNGTIFVGTSHAHLVALDAKTGAVRWDIVVADNKEGYQVTAAPLAIDGRIIVGVAGGDHGVRGFVDAYDPATGKRIWRTYTVPSRGEPAADSWGPTYTPRGGATWVTGTYDPELNLLYWGTGNPAALWNGDPRPGDNLYTCSLLALDPRDGKLRWHFQFTPHDTHDWDANQVPVLLDAALNGQQRKLVVTANRNGFYYVLDRETGEFLSGTPFAKQTWAKGLDAKGRPILLPDSEPSATGNLVYPSVGRAANWWSPSYSPQTRLFYQASAENGSIYFKNELGEFKPGEEYLGGGVSHTEPDVSRGVVRALDAISGKKKWEFELLSPPMAGLLSTAGSLVFGGSLEGNFFALDANTGSPLWDFQLGASVKSNPISYAVNGKQYVAIAAGRGLFSFSLP